jgi:predicted CXXCH cytochrome family protein
MSSADPIRRMCGLCHKPQPAKGARMMTVLGMRTWVCVGCAARRAKP